MLTFTSLVLVHAEPIPYYEFGVGSGPVVYSNVDCIGWENSLGQCSRETYLMFDCPPFEAAGVFCADCKYKTFSCNGSYNGFQKF